MEEHARTKNRLAFISHSSADMWVARQIAREIEACGATPFLDEAHIDVGADFEEDILNFLERVSRRSCPKASFRFPPSQRPTLFGTKMVSGC